MRRLAAAVVPDAVKRRHERWSTARYLAAVGPPTAEYVRRYGLTVRHGPFEGLRYEVPEDPPGDLVAKLAGTYESELHDTVSEWVQAEFLHVIDVGAAEGYYAVGFARAMPGTTVHAFDVDPLARARCAAMADLNGVRDRVVIGGSCTPSTLAAMPADRVALLSDCEGCERTLLDPRASPALCRWTILVELHEFLDPEIRRTITDRFAATHHIEVVEGDEPKGSDVPELAFLDPATRGRLLSERRPASMRWAILRPHSRS